MSSDTITCSEDPINIHSRLDSAILFLYYSCDGGKSADGKGFSKIDITAGHMLATKVLQGKKWTTAETRKARRLASKYSKQLTKAGFDVQGILDSSDNDIGGTNDIIGLIDPTDLFHSPDNEAYVQLTIGEHREVWSVDSKRFNNWLSQQYYLGFGAAPSDRDKKDAVATMIGMALNDGIERSVFRRVGKEGDAVFIDLCNESGQCVRVTGDGWSVLEESPVAFLRSEDMLSLPIPTGGKGISALRAFLNIESEDHLKLIVAWMVFSLQPTGPFPILVLQGEHGCGKSTMARVIRALVDPSGAPTASPPSQERDLAVIVKHSWVPVLDNLSKMPDWLSDALCRISTGGSFKIRSLYSNDELLTIKLCNPCILNSIEEVMGREDLRSRSITISLPRLTDDGRRTEKEFWSEFEKARPELFGALCDALSLGLRNGPNTLLPLKPRMADFAQFATAIEPSFGWEKGSVVRAYQANMQQASALIAESSSLATAVIAFAKRVSYWEGTAAELLDELERFRQATSRRDPDWPKQPNQLTAKLRRLTPVLRSEGVDYDRYRSKQRMITIRLIESTNPTPLMLPGVDASMGDGQSTVVKRQNEQAVVDGVDCVVLLKQGEKSKNDVDYWSTDDGEDDEEYYYQ